MDKIRKFNSPLQGEKILYRYKDCDFKDPELEEFGVKIDILGVIII